MERKKIIHPLSFLSNKIKTLQPHTYRHFSRRESSPILHREGLQKISDKVLLNGKFQSISENDFSNVAEFYNRKLFEHVTNQIMGYSKLDELFSADQ